MLLACHLFVGTLTALIASERWGRRDLVPLLMAGSLLPDLVDKPLGHLLMVDSLDNGRILFHGLAIVAALLAASLVSKRGRDALICLGAMVLVHQLMDGMWDLPRSWFFPALGPWSLGTCSNYFVRGAAVELGSPSEWMFGLLSLGLLARIYPERLAFRPLERVNALAPPLLLAAGALAALSPGEGAAVLVTVCLISAALLHLSPWRSAGESIKHRVPLDR